MSLSTVRRTGHTRTDLMLLLVVAGTGAVAYGLLSPAPGRAVACFLGGLVAATLVFVVSMSAVRTFGRISPSMGLAAAMMSYGTTVALFAAALAASSPRVVDAPALAIGFVSAAILGLVPQFRDAWVRD